MTESTKRSNPIGRSAAAGITTTPEKPYPHGAMESPVFLSEQPFVNVTSEAAHVLVETLFAGMHQKIPGIRYSVAYKLADGRSGGDIIDVFHYDNDHVSFAIADISGKGNHAAIHASMIKYGLRAYASHGMTAGDIVRSLDRLYLENNAFENNESFATVFFGIVDPTRRFLQYVNAAHEPVVLVHPDGEALMLAPTAPIVGVFEDQHHLFKQAEVHVQPGSLLVATTDGVSEARDRRGEQFGMQRLVETVVKARSASERGVAEAVLAEVERFGDAARRDDIAIIVTRFL